MRVSSTCFREWSDNEQFFQTPQDSFGFKLLSISKGAVFAIGIFPPQYSPSSSFSFGRNGAPEAHDAAGEGKKLPYSPRLSEVAMACNRRSRTSLGALRCTI